jgi:hypothetical protein
MFYVYSQVKVIYSENGFREARIEHIEPRDLDSMRCVMAIIKSTA